jgi:glycosyltransferase involved in cell wall biosynthesis
MELGIEERVTMTGMVEAREKAALLNDSSVFVLASEDENFGLSAVEAMSVGVPIIVSEAVAVSSDVVLANAGLLIERDRQSLAAALFTLLLDSERRKMVGENGRRLVRSKYSLARVGRDLERLYALVIDSRQDQRGVRRSAASPRSES